MSVGRRRAAQGGGVEGPGGRGGEPETRLQGQDVEGRRRAGRGRRARWSHRAPRAETGSSGSGTIADDISGSPGRAKRKITLKKMVQRVQLVMRVKPTPAQVQACHERTLQAVATVMNAAGTMGLTQGRPQHEISQLLLESPAVQAAVAEGGAAEGASGDDSWQQELQASTVDAVAAEGRLADGRQGISCIHHISHFLHLRALAS